MIKHENRQYKKADEWETPIEYLEVIEPIIPKDLTINDPFYMNGNVKAKWKTLGRDIIHNNENFFLLKKDDSKVIYVSSPPYSKTNQVLEHLFYLDKPFILLIPMNKIAHIKTQRILKKKDYLQLIPSPVYTGFITPKGVKTRNPPNYNGFLCYKLFLNKDLLFI